MMVELETYNISSSKYCYSFYNQFLCWISWNFFTNVPFIRETTKNGKYFNSYFPILRNDEFSTSKNGENIYNISSLGQLF